MKKIVFICAFFIATSLMIFISCKKDINNPPDSSILTGNVSGKVLAQNGTTPIPNATVFVDDNGEIYLTKSGIDGSFNLQAPIGQQVLNIQTGGGRIFRAQYNVTISTNQTTTVPAGTLKLLQAESLAFIPGLYDKIENIIIDSLGYCATEISVADLDNLAAMDSFGAIFLNCGKQGLMDETKYQNLLTYVQNGGSLYASDWAIEYLTGDGNYKAIGSSHEYNGVKYTCPIGPVGGFIADSILCAEKTGPHTIVNDAQILAQDLVDYLGASTIDIEYDLGSWEVIENITLPWEVLIQDNTNFGPLAARYYMPPATKSMKNMLEQGWVTICHIPPGNPANAHTITVSINALPAHLAHGDYEGTCQAQGLSGGVIYYTTFHNEVQSGISNDVQHILQYFILNM